jgi:hypothetical protein
MEVAVVTPEQRQSIMSVVVVPGRDRAGSPGEVLRQFGTDDGQMLGLELLRDAAGRRDAVDLELALIVCFMFGFTVGHLELLIQLAVADWHQSHENVVSGLSRLRSPEAIGALVHAARWVPPYLDFDDSRALARNAIWALGAIPGPGAQQALTGLLQSESGIVREGAEGQLARRAGQ